MLHTSMLWLVIMENNDCDLDLGSWWQRVVQETPIHSMAIIKWALTQKTCLWGVANNKGADQHVHPYSLISSFVIRFLERNISKLATDEMSICLASLRSSGDWFESRFDGSHEDRFCHVAAQVIMNLA